MFQTEPILWLQSFASDWLTAVMGAVSTAGNSRTYLAALVIVGFAGDFRMAMVLSQGVLWNLVLAGCLKEFVALPRPGDFDPPVTNVGLLGLPSAEAIAGARAHVTAGYGFPSGHAGNATVLWGGVAVHARSPAVWGLAAALVLAIGVSRVYLGLHFVADVLGGVLTGGIVLAVVAAVFLRPGKPVWSGRGNRWLTTLAAGSALLPPLILALQLGSNPTTLGRLSGFDGALLLLMRRELPCEAGSPIQRASRVLLAFGLYASVDYLVTRVLLLAGAPAEWREYAAAAAATFALLIGTVRLSAVFSLYTRRVAPPRITAPTASPG
jgi:membrane-associated phospholipid phosphatase